MNRQPHSAIIILFVGCGVVRNSRGFSPGEDVNYEVSYTVPFTTPVSGIIFGSLDQKIW